MLWMRRREPGSSELARDHPGATPDVPTPYRASGGSGAEWGSEAHVQRCRCRGRQLLGTSARTATRATTSQATHDTSARLTSTCGSTRACATATRMSRSAAVGPSWGASWRVLSSWEQRTDFPSLDIRKATSSLISLGLLRLHAAPPRGALQDVRAAGSSEWPWPTFPDATFLHSAGIVVPPVRSRSRQPIVSPTGKFLLRDRGAARSRRVASTSRT